MPPSPQGSDFGGWEAYFGDLQICLHSRGSFFPGGFTKVGQRIKGREGVGGLAVLGAPGTLLGSQKVSCRSGLLGKVKFESFPGPGMTFLIFTGAGNLTGRLWRQSLFYFFSGTW